MKLALDIKTALTQTLTPQQIQYLKILQMTVAEFQQYLELEIEQNPLLENPNNPDNSITELIKDLTTEEEDNTSSLHIDDFNQLSTKSDLYSHIEEDFDNYTPNQQDDSIGQVDEYKDPFEFHDLMWQDDQYDSSDNYSGNGEDEDYFPFQIKDNTTFIEDLETQFNLLELSEIDKIIGMQIIGNIDEDGYLRITLDDILNYTNSQIAEMNFQIQHKEYLKKQEENFTNKYNPAAQFALSNESKIRLENAENLKSNGLSSTITTHNNGSQQKLLTPVNIKQVQKVHSLILHLDPPGVGSRDIQECLLAQLSSDIDQTESHKIAYDIILNSFDSFSRKHFDVLMNKYGIDRGELKDIMDIIKRLNPKPGTGNSNLAINTVIPDFIINNESDSNELIITLNDNKMPSLKVSQAYDLLKKSGKFKNFHKETKEWFRKKNEDAKFIIQAIQQRKITMLKVMTAIAHKQKNFFYEGTSGIKPLIYKDIADETNIDISTVCRIVNNKYVLTEFGTFELKFFFSESLPNIDGIEMSTTIIKDELKKIIDSESKDKPYSDDTLAKLLKKSGIQVARRTIAKYREQLRIPVARLRKEL